MSYHSENNEISSSSLSTFIVPFLRIMPILIFIDFILPWLIDFGLSFYHTDIYTQNGKRLIELQFQVATLISLGRNFNRYHFIQPS